jgi:hypothetical protein
MPRATLICFIAACVLVSMSLSVAEESRTGDGYGAGQSAYSLETSVLSCAGSPGASSSFRGNGTLAQPTPVGVGHTATLDLYAGFWTKPWSTASVLETAGPEGFRQGLSQNFPNPFRSVTTIGYSVTSPCNLEIAVFDIRGRVVRILVDEMVPAGTYSVLWDGIDQGGTKASPGLYFYRLRAGSKTWVKKMVMLK